MGKTEEKPRLTEQERAFLEAIDEKRFWIARDKFGLFLYDEEPQKTDSIWNTFDSETSLIKVKGNLFPFITWESGKAWSRADLLVLEVEE